MSQTNLVNPRDSEKIARGIARDIKDERVVRWFSRNAARWLRQRADCATPVAPGTPDLPQWAVEAMAEGRPVHAFVLGDEARDILVNINHWLRQAVRYETKKDDGPLTKIARHDLAALPITSVEDATTKANAWFRKEARLAAARRRAGPAAEALEILPAPDNHIWERAAARGLLDLGDQLFNSLRTGVYDRSVRDGRMAIWGLRDPHGRFVAALTVSGDARRVEECKGHGNQPAHGYGRHVVALMRTLGITLGCPDTVAIGILEAGGAFALDLPPLVEQGNRRVLLMKDTGNANNRTETLLLITVDGHRIKTEKLVALNHYYVSRSLTEHVNFDTDEEILTLCAAALQRTKWGLQGRQGESALVETRQGLVSWRQAVVRQGRIGDVDVMVLTDRRALVRSTDGKTQLLAGPDHHGSLTANWQGSALIGRLAGAEATRLLDLLDPDGRAIVVSPTTGGVRMSINTGQLELPPHLHVRGRWQPIESFWNTERVGPLEIRHIELDPALVGRVREGTRTIASFRVDVAGVLHLEGNFRGRPEHVVAFVEWVRKRRKPTEIAGLPEFIAATDTGLVTITGKPTTLESGGEILKRGNRWYARSADGAFLWTCFTPRKLQGGTVNLLGDAEAAAAHLAETCKETGISFTRVDWLTDAGWALYEGRPSKRPFANLDLIEIRPDLRLTRTTNRYSEQDLQWRITGNETYRVLGTLEIGLDGRITLQADAQSLTRNMPELKEAALTLSRATNQRLTGWTRLMLGLLDETEQAAFGRPETGKCEDGHARYTRNGWSWSVGQNGVTMRKERNACVLTMDGDRISGVGLSEGVRLPDVIEDLLAFERLLTRLCA
jgi:hypothetical protein